MPLQRAFDLASLPDADPAYSREALGVTKRFVEYHLEREIESGRRAIDPELIERFRKAPKPMYYQPQFLDKTWAEYKRSQDITNDNDVNPDDFIVCVWIGRAWMSSGLDRSFKVNRPR